MAALCDRAASSVVHPLAGNLQFVVRQQPDSDVVVEGTVAVGVRVRTRGDVVDVYVAGRTGHHRLRRGTGPTGEAGVQRVRWIGLVERDLWDLDAGGHRYLVQLARELGHRP